MDGAHGMAYIAPSPSRPRPYHMITSSPSELALIHEAERNIQHMLVWNYYRRDAGWRVMEMKAEGTNLNCYDSILVNSKGRRFCRHPDYDTLNGHKLDETGCAIEEGNAGIPCTPTESDFEVLIYGICIPSAACGSSVTNSLAGHSYEWKAVDHA